MNNLEVQRPACKLNKMDNVRRTQYWGAFEYLFLLMKHNNAFSLRIVELHITVNNIEILSVEQQCFLANSFRRQQ